MLSLLLVTDASAALRATVDGSPAKLSLGLAILLAAVLAPFSWYRSCRLERQYDLSQVAFRDWLRTHPDDRELYEREKRRLAEQHWDTVQDYADAKTEVIREIVGRALAGDGTDVHGTDDGAGRP